MDNYREWRDIHSRQFGAVFSSAFEEDETAQLILTAALIAMSQRRFDDAAERLDTLVPMCVFDHDKAALAYFRGLNYEMLGDLEAMTACYSELLDRKGVFEFSVAFHPYYRTAKFAQRDAECTKALYYYQKALEFYEDVPQTPAKASVASCLLYDYATVCLYMHRYDSAEQALSLSRTCYPADFSHRSYVTAILYAVKGQADACLAELSALPESLRTAAESTVAAIQSGTDPHYAVVPQDAAARDRFLRWMHEHQPMLAQLTEQGELARLETCLSEILTQTFPFMQKALECRVSAQGKTVTVRCKTYCVKTLTHEYNALFSALNEHSTALRFTAVDEFEHYPL